MIIGLGLGLGGRAAGAAAAAYDPAVLALTGWWRANYVGSPWTPTASAGSSASNGDFAEATNPPATGSAVNGLTPADFDGSNDVLASATTLPTLVSVSAGTIIALFNADAVAADEGAGAAISNAQLFTNASGHIGMSVSASGLRCALHDGAYREPAANAFSTGAWVMGMMRWNGTVVEQSVNAGTATSTAAGNLSGGNAVKTGANYAGTVFFDGKLLELMTIDSFLSDATLIQIKSYFNAHYGLSL